MITPAPRLAMAALLAFTAAIASPSAAWAHGVPGQEGPAKTWFVRAAGNSGGDGSRGHPFATLSAVQAASHPGDRIVVLQSRRTLDGGIRLKPRQRLLGAGPSVRRLRPLAPAPKIENSSPSANAGDAIELADGVTVSNIAVVGADRGGIYGSNVRNVSVRGNRVSATNTSCTTGFVVQPFVLPTTAPGVGVPFSSGLANGWAAIMVDETRWRASVSIRRNLVKDVACGDGIDVRASGAARVEAHVTRNRLTRLHQGAAQQSILAIGMQTRGTARLAAHLDRNRETYIGTASVGDFGEADSEGLFANSAGRSHLIEHAAHNTFAHGLGHISANCVEVAASNGGPTMHMTLSDSTCKYVVGDILEAGNLSRDATMTFDVDHVRAAHSTFVGSTEFHQAEPGDDGDCMLEVASGASSTTIVNIHDSVFTKCVADGLGVVSNVVDGSGPVKRLGFAVENSRIADNKLSNLRVVNATPISKLDGRVEDTDLSESAGTPVILEGLDTSGGTHPRLDLGGGSLGSRGHNCIFGGAQTDVEAVNYDLWAGHDWWGTPGGPAPGRTIAAGSTIFDRAPLTTAACGPTTGR
jgi:hypothetical protein